jgi:N-methylhydantoinase B
VSNVDYALVSPEHAREAYGVVLKGHRVDEAATGGLRAARRALAPGAADAVRFDFGPARGEHERRWPPDVQDALIELLMSLPAPYRRTCAARSTRAPRRSAPAGR